MLVSPMFLLWNVTSFVKTQSMYTHSNVFVLTYNFLDSNRPYYNKFTSQLYCFPKTISIFLKIRNVLFMDLFLIRIWFDIKVSVFYIVNNYYEGLDGVIHFFIPQPLDLFFPSILYDLPPNYYLSFAIFYFTAFFELVYLILQ